MERALPVVRTWFPDHRSLSLPRRRHAGGMESGVDLNNAITVVDNPSRVVSIIQNSERSTKGWRWYDSDGILHLRRKFPRPQSEIYDSNFSYVKSFRDSTSGNYAPFGIQAIGQKIYVTYAEQDDKRHDDVPRWARLRDVFGPHGAFIQRLVTQVH